ncbi:Fe-S cluster assembly ATPase SufC, partial [bacterium]|nr:Fe-S cluster assembly ATPase SufC [bacterium]
MLQINNFSVSVQKKQIVKNCSLLVKPGTVHIVMGQNGSGKSTLAHALIGDSMCTVEGGTIFFEGKDITNTRPDERARLGLFLTFQHPCVIPGLSVFSFLKEAYNALLKTTIDVDVFRKLLYTHMDFLDIDRSFAFRDVHEGFSGGEKKRLEVLQLLLFKPKIVILDELDSGLDIDA